MFLHQPGIYRSKALMSFGYCCPTSLSRILAFCVSPGHVAQGSKQGQTEGIKEAFFSVSRSAFPFSFFLFPFFLFILVMVVLYVLPRNHI